MAIKEANNNLVDNLMRGIMEELVPATVQIIDEKIEEISTDVDIKESMEDSLKFKTLYSMFKNGGYADLMDLTLNREKVSRIPLKDLLTSEAFTQYFPKVVSTMAQEAAEPEKNFTKLLEVVPFEGQFLRYPVFSAAGSNYDMAEGDEPRKLELASGRFKDVTIGKAGLKIDVTDEAIKYNDYNLLNMYIKAGAKALERWKEVKAVNLITSYSAAVIDNEDGSLPNSSGVGLNGTANGGLDFSDIVKAIVTLMNQGFNADTIVMNPMAYPIFMNNGTLRSLFWLNGGQGNMYNIPDSSNWMENIPGSWRKPAASGRNVKGLTFPTGLINRPLNIVLSPFMSYTAGTPDKTDIIIGDSSSMGMLVVNQLPTTDQVDDRIRQISSFILYERYAIAPHYNGQGTVSLKNINVTRTYDFEPYYSVQP